MGDPPGLGKVGELKSATLDQRGPISDITEEASRRARKNVERKTSVEFIPCLICRYEAHEFNAMIKTAQHQFVCKTTKKPKTLISQLIIFKPRIKVFPLFLTLCLFTSCINAVVV